jgi:hypothetical protein
MSQQFVVVELVTPQEARIYEQTHNIKPFTQQVTTQKINTNQTPQIMRRHESISPTPQKCCVLS